MKNLIAWIKQLFVPVTKFVFIAKEYGGVEIHESIWFRGKCIEEKPVRIKPSVAHEFNV